MSTPAPKPDAFDKLLDTYVEELKAMSDEQALGGVDSATMEKEGLALLQQSRDAAGRRRLAAARAKLAQQETEPVIAPAAPAATVHEARRFLEQAANDGRYTMAARDLKDMSDEEALRLYALFHRLEGNQAPPSDEA